MTRRALGLLLAAAASSGAAASARGVSAATHPAQVLTVGCDQIVDSVASGHAAGYRVVLGVVSAPPAALPGVVRAPEPAPFPYWRKAGMVIRGSGKPVTVTVPKAWRRSVRVGWGNGASPATAVRFAACPSRRAWNAYAGGFFLRSRSACVPLVLTVGRRHATLRFGLGRRCRDEPGGS